MTGIRLALVASTALLLAVAPAFAQRVEGQVGGRRATDAPLLSPDSLEKLKLNAEQKAKYAKVETEYDGKVKAAQEKYQTDILGLNDRAKAKEFRDKLQDDTKKAREDHLARVEPILAGDQKTVFAQVKVLPAQPRQPGGVRPIQVGGGIGEVLPAGVQNRLQLTDEQKKEVDKIQKEVEARIMKVLTDEQKKQLEQIKKAPRRVQPIQPAQPNLRRVQPAVPNVIPAPDVMKD